MSFYDYSDPALAPQAIWVALSALGGFVLVCSTLLLVGLLLASHARAASVQPPLLFSLSLDPPRRLPASLNGFGVWMLLVAALTVTNYGFPLAQALSVPRSGVAPSPAGPR